MEQAGSQQTYDHPHTGINPLARPPPVPDSGIATLERCLGMLERIKKFGQCKVALSDGRVLTLNQCREIMENGGQLSIF